jgi:ParB-like chromosome segregation protein Spo0J
MKEPKNKVEYYKLSDLKPLENNPRTITQRQMDTLKKSIEDNPDYFEARPLIISDRTGELVILAGNQRYRAAESLNLESVPCVLIKDLDEDKEKEIIIRDNVSNGDWDFDILANEWDEAKLADWGVDGVFKPAPLDVDEFFKDRPETDTKEIKTIKCPNCGHEFEA